MSLRNHNLWIARAKKPHKLARTCANLKIQKRCFRLRSVAKTDAELGALTRETSDVQIVSHCRGRLFLRPRASQKWWFRLRRVAKTRFFIRTERAFLPFFKRWHAYKNDAFARGVSQKWILNLRTRTAVSHFILTRVFHTPRIKRKFLKSHQLRWICVPGVILERYVRKATEIKNMRFVRGVSQKRQNAYFGSRGFRRSPPRYFCDTPHAKRSFLTKKAYEYIQKLICITIFR